MAKNTKTIKLDDKTYIMTFGLGFLERLNDKYSMKQKGFDVSVGVPKAMVELQMGNASMVADMIRFATADLHEPPTYEAIENYVYEQSENPETTLFNDFFDYLMLAPGAKRMLKLTEQEAKKAQKKKK